MYGRDSHKHWIKTHLRTALSMKQWSAMSLFIGLLWEIPRVCFNKEALDSRWLRNTSLIHQMHIWVNELEELSETLCDYQLFKAEDPTDSSLHEVGERRAKCNDGCYMRIFAEIKDMHWFMDKIIATLTHRIATNTRSHPNGFSSPRRKEARLDILCLYPSQSLAIHYLVQSTFSWNTASSLPK